jgi:hypothetical protein
MLPLLRIWLGVCCASVRIQRPDKLNGEDYPPSLALYAVEASVAARILQMVEGRDNPDIPASVAFSEEQQQCLTQIAPTLQGRTRKQQNPYPLASLTWAAWFVARLGGWSAYRSQRPPGMPTLIQGLKRFDAIFLGWKPLWVDLCVHRSPTWERDLG